MNKINIKLVLAFAVLMQLFSCGPDEPAAPIALAFETTELGMEAETDELQIGISLSRATDIALTLQINWESQTLAYGTDFTTDPASSNGSLSLNIPAGAEEAAFTISKVATVIPEGASISFELSSVSNAEVQLIGNTELHIQFTAIESPGATITAMTGGSKQPNHAFVDLSTEQEQVALRESWDLGFYNGSEDRVILNYSTYAMAIPLEAKDLSAISFEDTVGISGLLQIGTPGSNAYVDDPAGDLAKTIIVPQSASQAPVYLINRGSRPGQEEVPVGSVGVGSEPRGWQKVRVIATASGYTVQYAALDATTFEEVNIEKDASFNFNYLSFDQGLVNVEPAQASWDIEFTVSSYIISFGPGMLGAYGFSDFVRINRHAGVEVAMVSTQDGDGNPTAAPSYEEFDASHIDAQEFSSDSDAIGSSWRSVFTQSAYDYRYYIVKDAGGSFYKLHFLSIINSDGERGHPTFKYEKL